MGGDRGQPCAGAACPFEVGEKAYLSRGAVNYRLAGPEAASLVVCIHGLNASLASFVTLQATLSERGFRVLIYDLYGFGLSAAPPGRLDPELYVHQLEELLDYVQNPTAAGASAAGSSPAPAPANIIGYCLGGLVATEFALRCSSRVARLLFVAPAGWGPQAEAPCRPLLFGCLRRRFCGKLFVCSVACLAWSCTRPARYYMDGKSLEMCTPDVRNRRSAEAAAVARTITARFAWAWPQSTKSCLRGLRDMPLWREDFEESLQELAASQVPVLFVWGTEDNVQPYAEAQDLVEELFGPRGASCILINRAGHGLLYDRQDVAQVTDCAHAWFTASQDPNWLSRLAGSSLQTEPDAESCPPQLVGAELA